MDMFEIDIMQLYKDNLEDLFELMTKALTVGNDLSLRNNPTSNPSEAAAIVLCWQLRSLRRTFTANHVQTVQFNENPHHYSYQHGGSASKR